MRDRTGQDGMMTCVLGHYQEEDTFYSVSSQLISEV